MARILDERFFVIFKPGFLVTLLASGPQEDRRLAVRLRRSPCDKAPPYRKTCY